MGDYGIILHRETSNHTNLVVAPSWIKDGSLCGGICTKPWRLEGTWIIGSCYLTWCKHVVVLHAKPLSIASSMSNLVCNGEYLHIMSTVRHTMYSPHNMIILLLTSGKHNNMSRTSQIQQISQPSTSQEQHMSFTLVLHLKYVGIEHFCTESWEAMAIQGSSLGPHRQCHMYDSNGNMTVGVFPRDLVLGEMVTWDIKHMLDIENLNANTDWQHKCHSRGVVWTTKIFISSWTSENTSMMLWTFGNQ